ncbi:multicopper oxidase domain-containing protein [Nitrosomonas sp.]|uniref:multicopper oxidase domain-containing protein n=1 Tax=Nitrosomonas sp. TaxID=42353 RepID=UPI002850646F|nr:multicopper oxidase domain-containing protein [Nitrosomonas sp.]MDR4514396.1 multicopper oxidase domain-containing protein [Nitrosomonas sp.]
MNSIVFRFNRKTMVALICFMATLFFSSIALASTTHTINLTAETLPNGQFGYKMVSHDASNQNYPAEAVIPGPSLIVQQGDTVNISLTNNTGVPVGINIPGILEGAAEAAAGGGSQNYSFTANRTGTHPYYDEGSGLLGLFGALIVNAADGSVQSYVDGDGTITPTDVADLDKEYIMFMVGSTFWGAEIANGTQTPLWTNPVLAATLNEVVRFHVLSIEHDHTFHLHAHRWLDEVDPVNQGLAPHIIDVKILTGKADSHAFTVKAGTEVGAGMWHLHCHVVSHMESNMAARFRVDEPGAASGISVAGASPYGAILLSPNQNDPGLVTFEISDEPGSWFRSTRSDAIIDPAGPLGALNIKTRSLEVMAPGSSAHFIMSDTNAVHTITTLIWPSDADTENKHDIPFDQTKAYRGGGIVQLNTPGLYVFTCKIHPYMFGAIIVDDPNTQGLDLGEAIDLVTGIQGLPTTSDLATRLLRTFFVVTAQQNWQDYTSATPWHVAYPDVPVRLTGGAVLNLKTVLENRYGQDVVLPPLSAPTTAGVGEVWINTQFEKTASKTKPGTITVLDTANWTIKRKIALPSINMNHPHNMWTDRNQSTIFQTQWFDNKLTFINRADGQMIDNIQIGDSPSHVMTMPNNDDITVAINGENRVVTIPAGTTTPASSIATQMPGQVPANPHGHWITPEGKVVTPNINTSDTGFYDGSSGQILARPAAGGNFPHGPHPIAVGVGKDKVYTSNLLDHSIDVYDFDGNRLKTINLIADYDPISPTGPTTLTDKDGDGLVTAGVLPIQTPVDPTGRVVVTANTGGTITLIDTSIDKVVAMLPCDPGCHGVNFGAKDGGGYYAYVTSKFSNRLIVVDPDPNGDGDFSDAVVAGTISMADNSAATDDAVVSLAGMGGQGVLAIPNVYNGWVQNLPSEWQTGLTNAQKNAIP